MDSSSDEGDQQRGVSRWQMNRRKKRRLYDQDISDDSAEQDSSNESLHHVQGTYSRSESDGAESSASSEESNSGRGRNDNDLVLEDGSPVAPQNVQNVINVHPDDADVFDPMDNVYEGNHHNIEEDRQEQAVIQSDSERSDNDGEAVHRFEATSESDTDVGEDEEQDFQQLYEGAPITVKESLMTVLALAARHKLTGQCIGDILSMISVHCPPNNNCVKTLFKFKRYFSMFGQGMLVFHYFCSGCMLPLERKDTICENCQGQEETSFFIEIPLRYQLQALMKRPGFFNDLQYRFERRKTNEANIEDIYDGIMYRNHFENNGFLSNPNNVSFSWYSDGVSVYKSSKFSIWPLFLTLNELSYKKRTLKENTLLAGLWFGASKPNPNVFLKPFHSFMTEFYNHGFVMEVAGNPDPKLMRGMMLSGVADLPAKSLFMRFKQFNGEFGCCNCMAQGVRYDLGNNAGVRVYPYSRAVNLRDNADIEQFARQALELRQRDPKAAVFGVKGPSLLFYMVPNMVRCTAIDKMHGVDYGVFKQVMGFWFDPLYANEAFSASALVDIVDARLSLIKPPSFTQRLPRSIKHHKALWKSAEYRLILMILSIPIFFGIVDEIYLNHHCLLVSAVYQLSQASVSTDNINCASDLLHSYVSQFEALYGVRHVGMNVHQLLHLADVVKDLGPLWVYSCYFYEDLNGKLINMIHGSRHAGIQVCSAASVYLNLTTMISELPQNSRARAFCENLDANVQRVKVIDEISPGVCSVGTYYDPGNDFDNFTTLALQDLGIEGGSRKYFHRLRRNGIMFYSSSYGRSTQKESSYVQIYHDNIPQLGRVKSFVKWLGCGPQCNKDCADCDCRYFVIVALYDRTPWFIHNVPNVRLPHLNKVIATNNVIVCPMTSLKCLCYYINVDDINEYIATPVNMLEAD